MKNADGKDSVVFRKGKIPLDSAFPSKYNDKVRDNVTHSFYDAFTPGAQAKAKGARKDEGIEQEAKQPQNRDR